MNTRAARVLNKKVDRLLSAGRLADAAGLAEMLVKANSADAAAWNIIGSAAFEQKRFEDARLAFEQVVTVFSASAVAWNNLARANLFLNNMTEGERCAQQAIVINPLDIEFYKTLSYCISCETKTKALVLETAEKRVIDNLSNLERPSEFFIFLAKIRLEMGCSDAAEKTYVTGLTYCPESQDLRVELGNLLFKKGAVSSARVEFEALVLSDPNFALGWQGLAMCQQELGQFPDAISSYLRALEADSEVKGVHQNLATICAIAKEWKLASKHARLASLQKENPTATLLQLDSFRRQTCDWPPEEEEQLLVKGLQYYKGTDASPFLAMALTDSPDIQAKLAAKWHSSRNINRVIPEGPISDKKRIRIGWFSNDFYDHATMFLIAGVFREYDSARFDFHIYDYGQPQDSDYGRRLRSQVDQYHLIHNIETNTVLDLVRSNNLDIAIDLKGFTRGSRTEMFDRGLAPLQITFLGYPGTSGNSAFDYMIADNIVITPELRAFYTESVMYMPHCYQPNDNQRIISTRLFDRVSEGLPQSGFVFACFNQAYKIGKTEFSIWMRLLDALPDSVLWLYVDNQHARKALRLQAIKLGIDPTRLVFASSLENSEHLARCRLADLFLDCFHVNAHTSASDVLWAGVPVVTKQGLQFSARVCSSLLHAAGLSWMVASSNEEYFELAHNYATNPELQRQTLEHLAKAKYSSALFSTEKYTRDLERLLETAHAGRLRGDDPADIQ